MLEFMEDIAFVHEFLNSLIEQLFHYRRQYSELSDWSVTGQFFYKSFFFKIGEKVTIHLAVGVTLVIG